MLAIRVHNPGGVESLMLENIPEPVINENEVLVDLKAIGVNYIDVYYRTGLYPAPLPFTDGMEGCGIISAVGNGVKGFKVGDRVAYVGVLGAYAEKAAVPAEKVVKIPDELSFKEAASAMVQGITAQYLTTSTYSLKKDDTCLIHAAAGGVGLLLCQITQLKGAISIGTVSSEEKAKLAQKVGCQHVIIYTKESFLKRVQGITQAKGVQVVYDSVGKTTFADSLDCLAPRGFMVLFGQSSGVVTPFDLSQLAVKGSLFITRPGLNSYIATREELLSRSAEVFSWIISKRMKLNINHEFPLAQAAQAHRALESRQTTGKILLIPHE